MRKWMICASFVLAMLQLWPMVFGHKVNAEVQAAVPSTQLIPAVATAKSSPIKVAVSASSGPQQSCYTHYRAAYSVCIAGDHTCRLHAADAWDLCEATGTWAH